MSETKFTPAEVANAHKVGENKGELRGTSFTPDGKLIDIKGNNTTLIDGTTGKATPLRVEGYKVGSVTELAEDPMTMGPLDSIDGENK